MRSLLDGEDYSNRRFVRGFGRCDGSLGYRIPFTLPLAHNIKIILLFMALLRANISIIRIDPDPLCSHTQVKQQT